MRYDDDIKFCSENIFMMKIHHTHIKTSALALQIMCIAHTHNHTQEREQIHKEAHLSYLKPMYEMAHVLSLDP